MLKTMTVTFLLLSGLSVHAQVSVDSLASLRNALVVPPTIQQRLHKDVGVKPIGYEPVDMLQYGSDHHLLRSVSQSFRNVLTIPLKSGQYAKSTAKTTSLASLVRIAASMSDIPAGRMTTIVMDSTLASDSMWHSSLAATARQEQQRLYTSLPISTRRLIAQIVRAADDADPFLHRAFRKPAYHNLFTAVNKQPESQRATELYRAVTAPWTEDRQGQYASTHPFGLDGLDQLDRKALTFCAVVIATHLDSILSPWIADTDVPRTTPMGTIALHTRRGWIICTGSGTDTIAPTQRPLLAVIDAGGDDLYLGRTASTMSPGQYFSFVVDRSGNDRYESPGDTAAICAGVLGVAALIDVEGNDRYLAKTLSIASAFHGVAIMQDRGGDDVYELQGQYGQAAATAGIAVLDDHAGDDLYICAAEAQAYAQTLGGAILVDRDGHDRYLARLDGAPSEMYLGQTVSRAQGASFGRRADMGDGHSLAGGVALLLDVRGNDTYTAGAWSQGCGYWWALGMLEDWDGNDVYTNGKYSLGAGAHFAIGSQVDLQGNDAYNVGNSDVVNQFQGHARDGSIGVSIDGSGDDRYLLRSHCGGSGDLCSIGFFWDREGNDVYECDYTMLSAANGWTDTPPLGTTTRNEPFGTFRDEMVNIGIFLDGVGADDYQWRGESTPHSGAAQKGYSVTLEP